MTDPTVHSPGVLQPQVLLLGFSAFEGDPEGCSATGSRRGGAALVSTVFFYRTLQNGAEKPQCPTQSTLKYRDGITVTESAVYWLIKGISREKD